MNIKYSLRFTYLFLLVALVNLACSSSGKIASTATPTVTPTYYYVQLPASMQSTSGWKITLSALDLQTTLGEKEATKKMFLVGLVEIENLTGKSDCVKSDQFFLQYGLQRIKMERDGLEAGKSAYARDYPGTMLGQCLDANEKQESVLVFDIPDISEELDLIFQEQTLRLGMIEAIRNPLPTITPTATATSTATPAITPTYYFVQLPTSIQSTSGWKITLSALDLQTALGETKATNQMFLVGLVEIENLTGQAGCVTSDHFLLQNGLKKIKMEFEPLEAGKSAYARDYPGTILGQCFEANEKQESVLVFDIPDTSEDLGLIFQDQTMRLGKIEAIRNPLPTLTPTATAIVPPTATFTPTPKPTATVIPNIEPSNTSAPTSTENASAILPGLTPADVTENLEKIGLTCNPVEAGQLYYTRTCEKETVEFLLRVDIFARELSSVDYIDSSVIQYTNVVNELPQAFFGFLATMPYDGAVQDKARTWVETTLPTIKKRGDSAEKVFAGVTYRLSGLPTFLILEIGGIP